MMLATPVSSACLPPTAYCGQHPLAFTFLNWGFFWAGLALPLIPIVIHLLNRRRFRVVTWAAMDFLLRAMKKNRKRLKFEQWILLAARCLLVFLIAFALARPLVGCDRQSLAGAIGGRAGMNVFVIDNSYSTQYQANHPGPAGQPGGKNHLEQEKLIARRIIDGLNPGGESVAIITAARPATAIIARPGYDLNAAKAAVDRIEPSYAGTDLAGALQLALKLAEDEPSKSVNKNLYLLTDGTMSAWEGAQKDAIKKAGPDLAKEYRVTHYNMTEGRQQWNQAVADIQPASNLVTTKFPTELLAYPQGYGLAPESSVKWLMDGQPMADGPDEGKPVALTPKTAAQKKGVSLKVGGPHVFTATIGGDASADPLKVDNVRHRVIDVTAELKVLIVEGSRTPDDPLKGSGAFLQLALAPPAPTENQTSVGPPKSSSYVSVDLISNVEDFSRKPLADYRAVILAGVGQITEQEGDALKVFVEGGGTAMIFMGEPVSKENYNAVLLPRKLMPGPLIKLVDSGQTGEGFNFDFKPHGVVNPFLKVFAGVENSGLETAKVFTYWQADVPPDSGVDRVLNYLPGKDKDGTATPAGTLDPAITHHTLGLGHVLFVSTSASPGKADKPWTSLPAKMVYVELMHELLTGGVRPGDYWMNLTVGQPLEIPPQVKLAGAPELKDDAGTSYPVEPIAETDPKTGAARPTVYRSRPLAKPGVYDLNLGNGTVKIAVNVPADEADVRTIGNDQVRKALGDIDVSLMNDEPPTDAALNREGNDWAWIFLLAVFALLGVEAAMAMMFGHYRRVANVES